MLAGFSFCGGFLYCFCTVLVLFLYCSCTVLVLFLYCSCTRSSSILQWERRDSAASLSHGLWVQRPVSVVKLWVSRRVLSVLKRVLSSGWTSVGFAIDSSSCSPSNPLRVICGCLDAALQCRCFHGGAPWRVQNVCSSVCSECLSVFRSCLAPCWLTGDVWVLYPSSIPEVPQDV